MSADGAPYLDYAGRLLAYLGEQGFTSVVAQVKDIRSDGVVLVPVGRQSFTDEQVAAFGRLLRAFHDAGAGFEGMSTGSVALKGDPGPMTTALVDGRPAILIGLHKAGPGDALDDVAASCWHWSLNPAAGEASAVAQAHQLRVLADAYGVGSTGRQELLGGIRAAQSREVVRVAIELSEDDPRSEGHEAIHVRLLGLLDDRDFVRDNLAVFENALR